MLNKVFCSFLLSVLLLVMTGCNEAPHKTKIGISFGPGNASRWATEMGFMQERSKQLGIEALTRFNKANSGKTQTEDCFDLLDSGIEVLIIMPRDVREVDEVLTYAKQKNVKVLSYARTIMSKGIDLFIGYDCYKIGQSMGLFLTEKVFRGDVIVLKGDPNDFNTPPLYYGAMKYIKPLAESGDLKIILDEFVPRWSGKQAKEMVLAAVKANGNNIDAILAPNDTLAAGAVEALQELNISENVVITGMDADINAVRRIVNGTQDMTVYMDLKELAYAAVDEAYNLATKQKSNSNSVLKNDNISRIDAYLINGKVVTKENIDKILIEAGHYTKEQVYEH